MNQNMNDHSATHPSPGFRRRTLLGAAVATAAAGALDWGAPAVAAADASADAVIERFNADFFARPGRAVAPKFRWWWPDGLVQPDEIRREIDQIADAGFGGAEIAAVHHSVSDTSVLDTERHGWGGAAWVAGVEAALSQAARRGITVDLTIGPSWPAAVPGITPDSDAAVKELAYGTVTLAPGGSHSGPVPAPVYAAEAGVTKQELLLVQAARVDTANSTRKETGLAQDSVRDLTPAVKDGTLDWTAPVDGTYVLISYWVRGSGQTPEAGPHTAPAAYVVDHFSAAGTRAVTDFWEAHILTPAVRRLLKVSGGALFEDSIELETDGLQWTPGLPEAFEKHTGRSLLPLLPAVVLGNSNQVFAFEATATRQIRHDFWETVSTLYNQHHVTALRTWAHGLGLELRAQPYGLQTDSIASAALLDIPEGESLGFKNLDDYRCLAGGRDMAGHTVLSCEAGAYAGGAYSTTWQKFLRTMGGAYAAGVNQTVVHGFSYAELPGVDWPGYAAFTPYKGTAGYGESWGPRHATWKHVPDIAGCLSRVHRVLQTGRARADVAVFRQTGYSATGIGASWFTASGITSGWTHQFLSGPLLDLPSATVRRGRLAPDGPAYKALFVEGDFFYGSSITLALSDARALLRLTRAGLPIVLLGAWDTVVPSGVPDSGETDELQSVVASLLAEPLVRRVADKTAVPTALAELGVRPDVRYATSSTLLNFHRVADGVDYYYLCNGKHAETVKPPVAAIDHEVTLSRTSGDGVPYLLDPWSGRVERIARYTEDEDTVTVRVALQQAQMQIVAIGRPGLFGDRHGNRPHAVDSEAERVRFTEDGLTVRASQSGTYRTVLSQGRTVRTTLKDVPAVTELTAWQLHVEDWRPGPTATRTTVVEHDLDLDALLPWSQIPALADVSGIGRYRTTVTLGEGWSGGHGAYLQLGTVTDTCRVTVNGHRLDPVDQIRPVVDLGGLLRQGRNVIEVEVATPLANRLRVGDPAVYGGLARAAYGLMGPVRLVPYGEARIG
ncbi:glycosyl hydrolase [Streptomyces sp. NPDC005481]|uniref:glycosyl hydrolase n=1 Tax=Streptomyces sp. NPDC005481 TaxID=3154881 RepID=UPI0033A09DFC